MMRLEQGKWENLMADGHFVKSYGPIKCYVYRKWPNNVSTPLGYGIYVLDMQVANIPIKSLPVDWSDDKADKEACKIADKVLRQIVKGWFK